MSESLQKPTSEIPELQFSRKLAEHNLTDAYPEVFNSFLEKFFSHHQSPQKAEVIRVYLDAFREYSGSRNIEGLKSLLRGERFWDTLVVNKEDLITACQDIFILADILKRYTTSSRDSFTLTTTEEKRG